MSVSVSFCLGGGGGGQTGVGEDWFVICHDGEFRSRVCTSSVDAHAALSRTYKVYVHHLCMHMQHCMHVHVISARTHKFTNTIEGLLYC